MNYSFWTVARWHFNWLEIVILLPITCWIALVDYFEEEIES